MSEHALLLWMSARRNGSWQQFRSAVEELHMADAEGAPSEAEDEGSRTGLSAYQQLRLAFERLAHAEFFTQGCEDGWRITPPVLTVIKSSCGWEGILSGARSPRFLRALQTAADNNRVALHTESCLGQPPIIRTAGTRDALARFAVEAGVAVQVDAPLSILSCIPAVDDARHLIPSVLPMGADWRIDRFDPAALRWRASSRDEAASSRNSLFRFVFGYERHHFLKVNGRLKKLRGVSQGQIGKYLVIRRSRRHVLRYSPTISELTVPGSCRPPLLIDRALTLCSGSLAVFDREGSLLRYRNIPDVVAHAAARLLRQEI
jgi:hypothetical protein